MAPKNLPQPTNAELGILQVLWDRGPSTVRDIHEELNRQRPTGYTTVLKFLQIMTEKGLVTRDTASRSHVYKAKLSEEKTQKSLVGELLDRAYRGAADKLVLQALTAKKPSAEELDKIRKLLDEIEEKR